MESDQKSKFSQLWPQWIAAFEVFVLKMLMGIALGWIPPFLGLLKSPDSPYEVTKYEISWIASLISGANPVGVIIGSVTASYFGSKRTLNICGFFLMLAWTFLFFADRIVIIYITCLFKGLSYGVILTVAPVYISEISAANIRGRLISFISQGTLIGFLLGNLMGTYLKIHTYAAICVSIAILFHSAFFFLPETPHHMVRCYKIEEAVQSIQWYTRSVNTERELFTLLEFLNSSPKLPFITIFEKIFKDPVNRKMLFKLCLFVTLLQMTGLPTIEDFLVVIFTDAHVTFLKPTTVLTILTLINIPLSWIPIYTTDNFKRINLYSTGWSISAIALSGFALTYTLQDNGVVDPNIQWIIIMSAFVCKLTIAVSIMPIFMAFTSELFAPNVKTVCIGIVLITNGFVSFLVHNGFLFLVDFFTYKYVFFAFALVAVVYSMFVKIYMPETKGKTLQEIQKMLNRNKSVEMYPTENSTLI